MAKGAPKAALPKVAAAAPKTTGSVRTAANTVGQKRGAVVAPADTVGDICLLPDIAGFAH
jgi:hypothetical protein